MATRTVTVEADDAQPIAWLTGSLGSSVLPSSALSTGSAAGVGVTSRSWERRTCWIRAWTWVGRRADQPLIRL